METLKKAYNHTLQRYYNGCNYIEEHPEEIEKYMPVIQELLRTMDSILSVVPSTEEESLNGFKT